MLHAAAGRGGAIRSAGAGAAFFREKAPHGGVGDDLTCGGVEAQFSGGEIHGGLLRLWVDHRGAVGEPALEVGPLDVGVKMNFVVPSADGFACVQQQAEVRAHGERGAPCWVAHKQGLAQGVVFHEGACIAVAGAADAHGDFCAAVMRAVEDKDNAPAFLAVVAVSVDHQVAAGSVALHDDGLVAVPRSRFILLDQLGV